MKTKTEARRQSILQAAAETFREMGFERASMSDIRARIGGSKATLYNYFPSKESLFIEVVHQSKGLELEALIDALDPEAPDLRRELLEFGRGFLAIIYAPDAVDFRRLVIAQARHSEAGRILHERFNAPIEKQVAAFLKSAMKRGLMRTADPKVAAIHLLSLLESELLQRVMLGVLQSVPPESLAAPARRAVEVFLSGYGPHRAAGRADGPAGSRPNLPRCAAQNAQMLRGNKLPRS